jgi:hypothetical protein
LVIVKLLSDPTTNAVEVALVNVGPDPTMMVTVSEAFGVTPLAALTVIG